MLKLISSVYIEYLKANLQAELKKKTLAFKQKTIFMYNNAPACFANATNELIKVLKWQTYAVAMMLSESKPHCKPLEHCHEVCSRRWHAIYIQVWNIILPICKAIIIEEILKLTSVDSHLLQAIEEIISVKKIIFCFVLTLIIIIISFVFHFFEPYISLHWIFWDDCIKQWNSLKWCFFLIYSWINSILLHVIA